MEADNKNNIDDNQKFCPVNIECNWSKTLSTCTLLIADLRYMDDVPLNKRILILKTLIKEIAECDDCYDVPYSNIYSQYLHAKDIETPAPKKFKKEISLPFEKVQRLGNVRRPDPQQSTARHSQNVKSIKKETEPHQLFQDFSNGEEKFSSPRTGKRYSSPYAMENTMRSPTPKKVIKRSPIKRNLDYSDIDRSRSPFHDTSVSKMKSPSRSAMKKTYTNLQTSPAQVLGLTHSSPRRGKSNSKYVQNTIEEEHEQYHLTKFADEPDNDSRIGKLGFKPEPVSNMGIYELLGESKETKGMGGFDKFDREERTLEEMYPIEDLMAIKLKMKELLLKPRRMWGDNDKYLYESASKRPLKDLLTKIK